MAMLTDAQLEELLRSGIPVTDPETLSRMRALGRTNFRGAVASPVVDVASMPAPATEPDAWSQIESRRGRALPQAVQSVSAGDSVTQTVAPSQPQAAALPLTLRQQAEAIRRQLTDMESADEDMSGMQAYMRQRGEQGGNAMLNALAAQFAGEQFQPVQAQFLKRAMAAQDPMKVGTGMLTPDGQFIVDPIARRDRRVGALEKQAGTLEAQALAQETAAERLAEQRRQAAANEQLRRDLAAQADQTRRDLASNRVEQPTTPYYQPVQTADGIFSYNSRTGRMEPVLRADGTPIIGAQADPTLQGNIAGARRSAQAAVDVQSGAMQNVSRSDEMISQLDVAERLLNQRPTQSGVGAMLDSAGRLVGVTSQGAQVAAQLESISGWLVANVPRMEGPQSNFDVENYKTMAGKVGDRNVPVPERLAALRAVRALQEKYKSQNQEKLNASGAPATPRPSSNLSPAEQAELDALRKRFGR